MRNGLDVVRSLQAVAARLPMILLAEVGRPIDPARAMAAGAYDVVYKGPDLSPTLRLAIARALERQALARELAELRQQLEEHTRLDAASGLYSWRHFHTLVERELTRLVRYGGTLAVLKVTCRPADGIAQLLGPQVRDRIAREVGAVLHAELRLTDLAGGRADGTYLVALPNTDAPGAEKVRERLIRRLTDLEGRLGLPEGVLSSVDTVAVGPAAAFEGLEIG